LLEELESHKENGNYILSTTSSNLISLTSESHKENGNYILSTTSSNLISLTSESHKENGRIAHTSRIIIQYYPPSDHRNKIRIKNIMPILL